MQDDCIAVALGLPQLKILEQKELGEYFEVIAVYRREEASCPRCEQLTSKEHDRRLQWKQDRRLRDKVVYLGLIKRMAYGYRNMGNFRLRILATNSKGMRPDFSHLLT